MEKQRKEEQLEKILKQLAKEAKPDKKFGQMLQRKLKEKFDATYKNTGGVNSFFMRLIRFKLRLATALVAVLFTSTTIYAYNSDAVTNGHILYPLKRATEKVEGFFADSPEEKSDYYNKMAQRRMRELDHMEVLGISDEDTVKEAENMLTKAETETENIEEKIADFATETKIASPEAVKEVSIKKEKIFKETHTTKKELKREEIRKTREEFEKKVEKKLKKIKKKKGKEPEIILDIGEMEMQPPMPQQPRPEIEPIKPETKIPEKDKKEPKDKQPEVKKEQPISEQPSTDIEPQNTIDQSQKEKLENNLELDQNLNINNLFPVIAPKLRIKEKEFKIFE